MTLIEIGPRDFQSLIIHRHNAHYSLALKICELIVNSLAPEAGGSRYRFKDIAADEQRMGLIFQSFILNFYKRERPDYRVKSDRLSWNFTTASGQGSHLLPTMNTDVSLYSREKVILIECKWTREPLQHFRGSPSFRSAHLYQLYAYLRNHPSSSRQRVSGILLYPQVDEELRADYSIENHELSVRTLDLSADWHHIRTALQELINRRPPMLPMPTGAQAEHL